MKLENIKLPVKEIEKHTAEQTRAQQNHLASTNKCTKEAAYI